MKNKPTPLILNILSFQCYPPENEMMRSCCSTSVDGRCRPVDVEVARTGSCVHYNMQPDEEKEHLGFKIVLRTESDVEILDDGYKWKKYGKKKIKNSYYPRNYYRCAAESCKVKKRVERESQDPRFVITTYQGKHNHSHQ
ncbi:hypothetical protein V6N13_110173 [Hibiscus sabdariffa]|uniref:WRKY domain-containing protein n=1 Tax=Hibiscus sabdariffa TaxID=183260 RepID=A0ABR2BU50_9ROSI